MCVIRVSIPDNLSVDVRPAGVGAVELLEHENRAALTHHEAIAVAIKWTRGALWLVVTRRHGANDRERAKGEWSKWRFGGAAQHHVRVAVANLAESVSDRDRARGAAHRVRAVRTLQAKLDRDVAARRAAEDHQRECRIECLESLLDEDVHLRFGVRDTAQCAAHHRADPLAILAREIDSAVVECEPRRCDGEVPESFESLYAFLLEKVGRMKVVDLAGVATAKHSRVEARDGPHR